MGWKMNQVETTLLQGALQYAAGGIPVLPLHGKLPLTALAPNGSKNATTDADIITAWWTEYPFANIGLATGHDGFFVIDIDGAEGRANFQELRKQLGPIETHCTKTQSGGYHIYLRAPEGVEIRNSQSRKDGWQNIDVRGAGGYVVAPPSPGYLVVENGLQGVIAECPASWIEALTTTRMGAQVSLVTDSGEVAVVGEGNRNQMLASYGGLLRDKGADLEEIDTMLQMRNRKACTPPLDEHEVRKIAESMVRNYMPKNDITLEVLSRADADDVLRDIVDRCRETPSTAHAHETIDALIILEETDNPRYIDLCSAIVKTKAINKTTLVKLMKTRKNETRVSKGLAAVVDVGDAPTGLKIPHGYKNGEGGLYFVGDDGLEEILSVPLYVTRRLRTVVEKEEKLELRYKRDGEWHSIIADRSQATFGDGLKLLADRGLPVTGENVGKVVKYITQFETLNRDNIPLEQTVTKAGWIGSSLFYPGHSGDISYTPEYGTLATDAAFAAAGTLDAWTEAVGPLCEAWPLARLQIAASFAAPLLQVVGHRNFVVHLHGDSGTGKSAVLNVAMSVWGAPSALVGNFNTTAVGLEHRLALANGLPVALNERQHANKGVDHLVYMAGEGAGRTRGAKAGGLRSMQTWQMILLTNGEEPLVSDRAPEGARTRALEFEGSPIEDDALASSLYGLTASNHGHAGRTYMGRVLEQLSGGPDALKNGYEWWHERTKERGEGKVPAHLAALALICFADELRQHYLHGLSRAEAGQSTLDWLEQIIGQLASKGEGSELDREYTFMVDLVRSNRSHFASDFGTGGNVTVAPLEPTWGVWQRGRIFLYPSVFRDRLEDAGFRPQAATRRMGKAGLLEPSPHGDGKHVRWTVRRGGTSWVSLKMPGVEDDPSPEMA